MSVDLLRERRKSVSRKSSDAEVLRSGIIAELDATSLYQSQMETSGKDLKALLSHIRDEEKEHIAELTCALGVLDKQQAKEFMESHPDIKIKPVKNIRQCILNPRKKK